MTISASVLVQLATLGLSPEKAEAVARMLSQVEAETKAEQGAAIEGRRASDRERKQRQRHVKSRDVTGQDVTSADTPTPSPKRKVSPCTPSKENNPIPDPTSQPSAVRGESKSAAADPLPIAEAFELWDRMASKTGLSLVRDRTDQRCRHLRNRLASHGLAGWAEAVEIVAQSPFLVGSNDRGWKATFDFVVKAENFAKIRERSYDRSQSTGPPKPRRAGDEFADVMAGRNPSDHSERTIDGTVQRR